MRIIYEIRQLRRLRPRLIFPVGNILMIEVPLTKTLTVTVWNPNTYLYRTPAAVSLSMIFITEHNSTLPFTVFLLPSCRFDLRFFFVFFLTVLKTALSFNGKANVGHNNPLMIIFHLGLPRIGHCIQAMRPATWVRKKGNKKNFWRNTKRPGGGPQVRDHSPRNRRVVNATYPDNINTIISINTEPCGTPL